MLAMKYAQDGKRFKCSQILANGEYKGYTYYILNLGTHPCAYVSIPEEHPFYEMDYDCISGNIDCHWGLTYSGNDIACAMYSDKYKCYVRTVLRDEWLIGWDYAHYGDYCASPFKDSLFDGKRWNTPEIYEEVKSVINQVIAYEGD